MIQSILRRLAVAGAFILVTQFLMISAPLHADTVYLKNGRAIQNVRVKIRSGGVFVRYTDGRSESFPIRQLKRVKMGPVSDTPRRAAPARKPQPAPTPSPASESVPEEQARLERERVARESVRGDTWQPREDSELVNPWGNFAAGLLPVYSGLYRTGATNGGMIFSVLEAALLVNALDFATATRDNHVWNRYDTLAGGLLLYDFSQDGVLIPGVSGPALWYLSGGLSNQVTDMRGGLTNRRLMRAQAADLPPFARQEEEFSRRKRQAYALLAAALLADGLASYLSAADFNLGQWSGPRSQQPTTAGSRALRSLVLPGWGQFHSNQAVKGTVFAGTGVALVAAAGVQGQRLRRARQAYQSSAADMLIYGGIAKLSGYSDETGYVITRAIADPLRANVDRQERNYQNVLGLTAAFWLYNIVDALLGPSRGSDESTASFTLVPMILESSDSRSGSSNTISTGLQAGLRLRF